tara:strand:- start:153 stop:482 length:330 start_codon:yes stop_codon:yes gene_type:complete
MNIRLNLSQAEFLLLQLSSSKLEPIGVDINELMSVLKNGIRKETLNQTRDIGQLISKIKQNGHKDVEMISKLESAKEVIENNSSKTRDKYFDEEGNEKGKLKDILEGKL